ncbi:MAG: thiamine-phosphate pyrophosphorylase [Paracoccaceae bacterium]|jgi:thiamine-phosphate pyrophosphorylase
MADIEQPQIYLITPPDFELSSFPDKLAAVLGAHDVACVRLALATSDAERVSRAADAVRAVCHEHDVALVVQDHLKLVETLGLDGVHLSDGSRTVRYARKELGDEAIIGAFCRNSRHDGISAAEGGADYVSFGPVTSGPLGDGSQAEEDLFSWWSDMIEVPVVAEGGLSAGRVTALSQITDFFGIGEEIWAHDDPAAALKSLLAGTS